MGVHAVGDDGDNNRDVLSAAVVSSNGKRPGTSESYLALCYSERVSPTPGRMRNSLKAKKVERLMFLCLSANRVPEVGEVREELARQLDKGDTFREGTRAVQAGLVWRERLPRSSTDQRC